MAFVQQRAATQQDCPAFSLWRNTTRLAPPASRRATGRPPTTSSTALSGHTLSATASTSTSPPFPGRAISSPMRRPSALRSIMAPVLAKVVPRRTALHQFSKVNSSPGRSLA